MKEYIVEGTNGAGKKMVLRIFAASAGDAQREAGLQGMKSFYKTTLA